MLKTTPRLYQEKILSIANKGNTLVVLPTGMGKTLIALLLGLIRQKKGKILFMSPTKPLVEQHANTIYNETGIMPEILHGSIPFKKRKKLWDSAWIVATPQTVQRDLLRGISLKDFSLLIFDEAHRVVGKYAYTYVAKKYLETAKDSLILGLTASPGTDREKISEIVTHLAIKQIEVRTESDNDVKPYIKEKFINWTPVTLSPEYKIKVNEVKELLRTFLQTLKEMDYLKSADLSRIRKTTLIRMQNDVLGDFSAMSTLAATLKLLHALEMIETQGPKAYNDYLIKLKGDSTKAAKSILPSLPSAPKEEHPKIEKLMSLLNKNKLPAIVFTNYRSQIDLIIEKLKTSGIIAAKFVGQKKGMTQKKQKEILKDFREKKYSVLISTSVGEEGLDIPSVETIIFYEPVASAIRNIQRRGRLRKNGKIFIMMTKNTREEIYFYVARAKERRMIKLLKSFSPSKMKTKKPTQKTLYSFSEEKKIIVDDREIQVAKHLNNFILKRLEIGDFIVSERIAIERKTTVDFIKSIIDGRLFTQVSKLKATYEKPVMILEGSGLFKKSGLHPNAIRGAMISLVIDWGIPILFTKNEEDTAQMIEMLAKREWKEGRSPSIKVPKAKTIGEYQEFLISMLPLINLTLAKRLLVALGSPSEIFNASIFELMSIEGIGQEKAKKIRKVLEQKYGEK